MRLNKLNPVSKLILTHVRRDNTVMETIDNGWRRSAERIQLWVVSGHNLSTARVSDKIDKTSDLGLLFAWNGVLGGISDGDTFK